jgi:cell division protein FtsL
MKFAIKYCFVFGLLAFSLVLQSKFSNNLAIEIEIKKNEVRTAEKEISALKSELNSLFSSLQIKTFAEDTLKMKLTDPTNILTLENRSGNYSIKGNDFNIVEQIMTLGAAL